MTSVSTRTQSRFASWATFQLSPLSSLSARRMLRQLSSVTSRSPNTTSHPRSSVLIPRGQAMMSSSLACAKACTTSSLVYIPRTTMTLRWPTSSLALRMMRELTLFMLMVALELASYLSDRLWAAHGRLFGLAPRAQTKVASICERICGIRLASGSRTVAASLRMMCCTQT